MTNHSNPQQQHIQLDLDFPWAIAFLQRRGRELFGQHFTIHTQDHPILYKLIVYFLGLKDKAREADLDLSKGILLTGPVGCGKTSLMTLMRLIPPPERNHTLKPCRDISFEFINEGYQAITRYSKMSFANSLPKTYCFDDLGTERSFKYHGNECNVMAEILLSRYDLYFSTSMVTHVITNLSSSEIEDYYGNRVRSRMRELFNLVPFSKHSPDKRK